MVNKDFFAALDVLEREKGIDKEVFIEILQSSLALAYKKDTHEAAEIAVKLSPETSTIKVMKLRKVVDEVLDPATEISLDEARNIRKTAKVGDVISEEIKTKDFGRISAQTAKQVFTQRLGDIMKSNIITEFSEKEHEIVMGIVREYKGGNYILELSNGLEGVLGVSDQIPGEHFNPNDKIKVYVKDVKSGFKGVQIRVSRTNIGFVKRLFELEVPEIKAGLVEVKAIARDPGKRTKIAVFSSDKSLDPVGACVGQNGQRVNAIVDELNNEKIDIILWSANPAEYIARAMSPSPVVSVTVNEESNSAMVIVPESKLSLAIGKEGQNAKLAARLTGWKIDVKSDADNSGEIKEKEPKKTQGNAEKEKSIDERFAELFGNNL